MKFDNISPLVAATAAMLLIGAGCAKQNPLPVVEKNTPPIVTSAIYPITFQPNDMAPKEVTIKIGDIVEFRNSDLKPHWPASASHPAHTAYTEFDPKTKILPGAVWSFTFTKTGDWKFHDHLNAGNQRLRGVIHVTEK